MNEYKQFAYYYDDVMATIPYELWYDFIKPYLTKDSKILDLACGTGTLLTMLALDNYQVSGLDLSSEVIEIALEKAKLNRLNINYKVENMINFKHEDKYDIITCFFDSLNFIKSKTDLKKMFLNVYDHLNDGGYFIFDTFSLFFMDEYQENLNEYDNPFYKLKWETKGFNHNYLMHTITIEKDDTTLKEKYYEYYHDFSDIIPSNFKIIKVSGDFNDDYLEGDERILYVLQK